MKKYMLLKSLPLVKAGAEFTLEEGDLYLHNCDADSPMESLSLAFFGDEFGEWFEEIGETKKPQEAEHYWFVTYQGKIGCDIWENAKADRDAYRIGNCFRSREEAVKAVEKLRALKKLRDHGLKFCGSKLEEEGIQTDEWHITVKATVRSFDVCDLDFINNFNMLFDEGEDGD